MSISHTYDSGGVMEARNDAEPGDLIGGRYRLREPLGSGGFGRVWRAADEVLGVDVAVKEIWLPPQSGPDRAKWLERARREARNAARLRDQPNIVAVLDVVAEAERPWLVMRLVTGRSLADLLAADGPLEPAVAVGVARSLLGALGAAHAVGIVHRDVKPANVMLARDGQVLLTDFGISAHTDDTGLTTTGQFLGSAEYAAPERALGDEGGPASDLFSLGCTLYHAVQGVSPFRRAHAMGALYAVVHETPAPPDRAGALGPLINALMAKEGKERPTVEEALALIGEDAADGAGAAGGAGAGVAGGADSADTPAGGASEAPDAPDPGTAETQTSEIVTVEGPQPRRLSRRRAILGAIAVGVTGVAVPLGVALSDGGTSANGTGRSGSGLTLKPGGVTTIPPTSPSPAGHSSPVPDAPTTPKKPYTQAAKITVPTAGIITTSPVYSPDGSLAVFAESDSATLYVVDIASGAVKYSQVVDKTPHVSIHGMGFSPDGRTLAVDVSVAAFDVAGVPISGATENQYRVALFDVVTRAVVGTLTEPIPGGVGGAVEALAFSADGSTLAVGKSIFTDNIDNPPNRATISLWHVASRTKSISMGLQTTPDWPPSLQLTWVAFRPHSQTIATVDENGRIFLGPTDSRTLPASGALMQYNTYAAFTPDGGTLAYASEKAATTDLYSNTLLQSMSGGPTRTLTQPDSVVGSPAGTAFSADGKTLAVDVIGGTSTLWDVPNGTFIDQIDGETPMILNNGATVLTAYTDRSSAYNLLYVWSRS